MQDLQTKLNYVRDKIVRKMDYPYLSQNIQTPGIDEDKLLLLVSVLDHLEVPLVELENYALTTMLLQVALDTHEQVTNSKTDESGQRDTQLTVLAGTYFSGLYYKILAEQDDIQVIRILSEGIEMINDQKIIVYQKDLDGIDKLMDSLKEIESSLIKKLTSYFHAHDWDELISNFLLIKRLIVEKEAFIKSHSSVVFDNLRRLVFPKHGLKELSQEQQNYLVLICDRHINFSKEILKKSKSSIPFLNAVLDERIEFLLNQHQPVAKSLAEEG